MAVSLTKWIAAADLSAGHVTSVGPWITDVVSVMPAPAENNVPMVAITHVIRALGYPHTDVQPAEQRHPLHTISTNQFTN